MNASIKRIIAILIALVIVAVLIFAFPGILGVDRHMRADEKFLQGVNCEFEHDYACAQAQFEKAISIYPNDSRYYTHLARAQRLQGRFADAIQNYQKAKQVDPSDENVLPGLNLARDEQATQTAMPSSASPLPQAEMRNPTLPESIYPIFDEEFGIIENVFTRSQSGDDHIDYEIVDAEAYSGRYSLLIWWTKAGEHWASVVLSFDSHPDLERASSGQLRSIDLSPPKDYALQFFAKRGEASTLSSQELVNPLLFNKSIALKLQDQNLFITKSIGNQVVYVYEYDSGHIIPDGRLQLRDGEWQEFCLPLANFNTDFWISKVDYKMLPENDKVFEWSNVKQINIDADFFSYEGAVYIDAMRIISASDCTPSP